MTDRATKLPSYQFVWRADTVNFFDAGKHFEIARVEINAASNGSQHRLARARGAMHSEAHLDQVVRDILDLVFGGGFQHRNNHSGTISWKN